MRTLVVSIVISLVVLVFILWGSFLIPFPLEESSLDKALVEAKETFDRGLSDKYLPEEYREYVEGGR